MIELVQGFPDNVVALKASGQVTRGDYQTVLTPAVEAALKHHDKVRVYYQLGGDFSGMDPGAAWEDFRIGVEHFTKWERCAVVTDVDWIRQMIRALSFMMPGDMRVYSTAEDAEARKWIVSD